MAVWGTLGTQATADEIYAVALASGFNSKDAVTATAIALAESAHGITNAWNPKAPDDSVGLWQINMLAHGTRFGTKDQLVDPRTNGAAAFSLFRSGGGFCAWSTFDNGTCGAGHSQAYRQYLPEAQAAADTVHSSDVNSIVAGLAARANLPSTASGPGGQPISPPAGPAGPTLPGGIPLPSLPTFNNPLAPIGAVFAWFTVRGHWWAILIFVAGAAFILAGVGIYFRPQIQQAVTSATAAAEGAA